MALEYISTNYGKLGVDKRVGCFVKTLPERNAPNGAWWRLDEKHGVYSAVASNDVLLRAALEVVGGELPSDLVTAAAKPLAAELEQLRSHAVADAALRLSCADAARETLLALAQIVDHGLPKPELNNGRCSAAELRRFAELPEYSWELLLSIANAADQATRDVTVFIARTSKLHGDIASDLKAAK